MIKRTLQELCLNITDGKHGDCENEGNSGYYFISCKDIFDGQINYKNARQITNCLLYTSDAADEEDSVDLVGRRILKKKTEYKPRLQKDTTAQNNIIQQPTNAQHIKRALIKQK